MVAGQAQPAGDKVPVAEILIAAVRIVVARPADLLRLGFALALVFFFTGVLRNQQGLIMGTTAPDHAAGATDPVRSPYALIAMGLDTLVISIFAVAWHRLILLGPDSVGRGLGLRLGTRELLYWGRMWLCILMLVVVAGIAAVVAIIPFPSGRSRLTVLGVVALIGIVYSCGRWGPIFAATAIDQDLSFIKAWRMTTGNGGRSFGIYLLAGLGWFAVAVVFRSIARAFDLTAVAPYAALFIADVISCIAIAVMVTINALVFQRLTGGPA